MVVVVTVYIRVIAKGPCQKRLDRLVRIAGDSAVKPDSRFRQRRLRSAADAAADQRIHLPREQKARQRSMPLSVCANHLRARYLPVRNVIHLKLLCVPKMLKNHTVLIGYRHFHLNSPRLFIFSFRQ